MRFVVTSLPTANFPPGLLYTNKYCPRGEMENRIKEQQLELFSDRTSTHTFEGNQLRLWFSAIAYELKQTFRASCLVRTPLATATVGTIRTLRLLLGARVLISVRRVLISIFLQLSLSRYLCYCLSTNSVSPRLWVVRRSTSLTHQTIFQSWFS